MSSFAQLENYSVIKKIGEGSFGIVYKVKENNTQNYFAAKVTKNEISETQKDTDLGKGLYLEVNLMAKFNHPAILQFIGYSPTDFQGSPNPTIITCLAQNGTLQDVIDLESTGQSPSGWDFTKKLINIYGIAIGMQYLHKNNIIHRDLKPENIYMDESYCPKIGDFGFSKSTTSAGMSMDFQSKSYLKGTPIYLPPEIILKKTNTNTKEGDVYAFSLIVYEILTTTCPFQDLIDAVVKLQKGERPLIPSDVPDSYIDLIERCWSEEPEKRPTFDEIVEELTTDDSFITELVDESEFLDYLDYIEETKSSFNEGSKQYHFKDFVLKKKKSEKNIDNEFNIDNELVSLYPQTLFESLSGQYKELVKEAETNGSKQFVLAKNLIEGISPFQQNTQLGIKYLTKSIESGNNEAKFYYSRMLIEGNLIPEDLDLAHSILSESSIVDEPEASLLLGKIEYKKRNFENAKDYFIKASKKGNGESMFLYASMLMKGEGVAVDNDEALRYFTLAIKNGYNEKPLQIKIPQQQPPPPPQQQQQPQQKQQPVSPQTPVKSAKKEKRKSLKKQKQNLDDSTQFIKFVVAGDSNKTTFLMVLNDKPFPERYVPTIFENYSQDIEYEGKKYTFVIWDTAGQDEYDRLRPLSYSGANVVGLIFSMNSRQSFINVKKKWFREAKHYCKDAALVLFALCKDEYQEGNPDHVSIEEGKQLARELEIDEFLACSARTGEGISDVFPTLLRALESKHKEDDASCTIA